MELAIIGVAFIAMLCVLFDKISARLGIPMLLAFILLGMIFGSDGLFKIEFEDFKFAEQFCSIALIFIIFYGGFGTNWREGRRVAPQSALLSSVGVLLTALLAGLFCHFALGFAWLESMLIGAVLGSTDAASVFSVLRSKKLGLKYATASMLELESGSNDPWAYMLTVILLSVMQGGGSAGEVVYMIFAQVVFGLLGGVLFSLLGLFACKRLKTGSEGFEAIFITALALLAYAVPAYFGGNGYLSAYILGIVLGNSSINNKKSLVNYFDGMTGIAQMSIFFLLGLLSFPSQMPGIILPAVLLFLFLTFIARPLVVSAILLPFRHQTQRHRGRCLCRLPRRNLHRVCHCGNGKRSTNTKRCIPYGILCGASFHRAARLAAAAGIQKAAYDRRKRKRSENLYGLQQ